MYELKEATLDDWEDLKIMASKVKTSSKFYPYYEQAVRCIDFSESTLGGYLISGITNPAFKFYVLTKPSDEIHRVKGFIAIALQTQPCFKNPGIIQNVAFVPAVFCMYGVDARYLSDAVKDFCNKFKAAYVYGNVKGDGAYSHFLSKFGAKEISRTLLIELEDLYNG